MPSDPSFDAGRFERFAQDVLAPAVYSNACPLDAAVYQCAEPVPFPQAAGATFQPVKIGWEWGPVWSTAWFRVRGSVPRALAGRAVTLRFATGTEALLWQDGEPHHGLDLNRDSVVLFPSAIEGEQVDMLIEAACNHHLGQLGTHWDPAEFLARWKSEKPGKLTRCELAAYDETGWRLHRSYVFATQLMRELPPASSRAQQLAGALRHATNLVDARRFAVNAENALNVLQHALARPAGGSAAICHAVGHAHIDTAWLWPIRETKRKCLRTFATALANLERFPDFRFLCSQAQQYAWVEDDSPALFARIRERVNDGRWEPGGAMWIEPDCNLVSGESLVRQILYGVRYWRSRFGERGKQRHLYLPDTFGFTGALPQIMRLAGLDTFITHKLSWNQTNKFPHTHFVWRGLDGSAVLAHQMPGHDYNLLMSPRELRRGEQNHDNKDLAGVMLGAEGEAPAARYLQPFGYGDGGGGPTDWQILNGQLARDCEGVPRVRFGRVDDFCAALHADRESLRGVGEDFPSWEGELYLEAHRGTYTTQAAIKLANRRAEDGLRNAELLTWAGPSAPGAGDAPRLREELDSAWKLTLLNQFHDIIPGSSIGWVYDDAAEQLANVRETIDAHTKQAMERLATRMNTTGHTKPLMVFNTTSSPVSALVEHAGELVYAAEVPALGVRVVDAARANERLPASGPARFAGELRLSNGIIEADFDSNGSLRSLRRTGGPEICAPGREIGELVLFEDHPRHWDAWDIDAEYEQKPTPVEFRSDGVQIDSFGPLRARFSRRTKIGVRSSIIQEYVLDAGSPRLDVRTTVDWHESHRLLRALFHTSVRAARATFDGAFGHLQRSTRRNTSWERAAFEVPAHRWVDLSDDAGGRGLAVLNDCKYGHSCHDGVIGMSLLRAPKFPDENADMGVHRFTYSMMPHDGDWRAAGIDDQAELLNNPLLGWALQGGLGRQGGDLGAVWAPVSIEIAGQARVWISALKIAEDDDRLILRLVETRGKRGVVGVRWNIPVKDVQPVDLLEEPIGSEVVEHDLATGASRVRIAPFQIVTLAARRA